MKHSVKLALAGIAVLLLTTVAEATITIKVAEVQNGVALVQGSKAAPNADIFWEGARVTQANKGGNFLFTGVVPADCVGTLSDGTPIEVALLNCTRAGTAAYWRFEEGKPGTVASGVDSILDSSGNGLHGTPVGHPIYRMVSNPQSTVGLEFNGADARVFIPDHVLLQLTESLTLEAYIEIHRIPTRESRLYANCFSRG